MRYFNCATAILTLLSEPAYPHDWYTPLVNGHGEQCCGGHDCGPLTPGHLRRDDDGTYEVFMYGYWRKVDPWAILAIPSPDGRIHVCQLGGYTRCLILPGPTS